MYQFLVFTVPVKLIEITVSQLGQKYSKESLV